MRGARRSRPVSAACLCSPKLISAVRREKSFYSLSTSPPPPPPPVAMCRKRWNNVKDSTTGTVAANPDECIVAASICDTPEDATALEATLTAPINYNAATGLAAAIVTFKLLEQNAFCDGAELWSSTQSAADCRTRCRSDASCAFYAAAGGTRYASGWCRGYAQCATTTTYGNDQDTLGWKWSKDDLTTCASLEADGWCADRRCTKCESDREYYQFKAGKQSSTSAASKELCPQICRANPECRTWTWAHNKCQ